MRPLYFFVTLLLFFSGFTAEEKPSCAPVPGSCVTCDSVRRLLRNDAYAAAIVNAQHPSSRWYDSIFYDTAEINAIGRIFIRFYNNLPDSLAMLRNIHHYSPDFSAAELKMTLAIHIPGQEDIISRRDSLSTGDPRADSLLRKAELRFLYKGMGAGKENEFMYAMTRFLNIAALERQLKKYIPGASIPGLQVSPKFAEQRLLYQKTDMPLQLDGDSDKWTRIIVYETKGPCRPPDVPCLLITRKFAKTDSGCGALNYESYTQEPTVYKNFQRRPN